MQWCAAKAIKELHPPVNVNSVQLPLNKWYHCVAGAYNIDVLKRCLSAADSQA
jgi:hypothetical protein